MIKYKKRRKYKYNLHSDFKYSTGIKVDTPKDLVYLKIDADGELIIKAGYSWDGPSGPAIDTKNFMQGSLVHDALYQLLRERILDASYRKRADEILRIICKEDGMSKIRACWVYLGVRIGGFCSAKPNLLEAP